VSIRKCCGLWALTFTALTLATSPVQRKWPWPVERRGALQGLLTVLLGLLLVLPRERAAAATPTTPLPRGREPVTRQRATPGTRSESPAALLKAVLGTKKIMYKVLSLKRVKITEIA